LKGVCGRIEQAVLTQLKDKLFAVALTWYTGVASAAPRLNCNYGKLLYYIRNCVTIERTILGQ